MAISDSLAASSPYIAPRQSEEDKRRARLLERGANLRPCPECHQEAEHEPTCLTVKGGKHLRVTVVRCPQCNVLTRSEEIPAPEPVREETPPMPEVTLCECGCGAEPRPGRRFASKSCAGRTNAHKMAAKCRELRAAGVQVGGRKKSSPTPAGEHAPTLPPDPPPAGEGNTPNPVHSYLSEEQRQWRSGPPEASPPPAPTKLCDCGCGRQVLGTRRFASTACFDADFQKVPSALDLAKSYLRSLTPEGRQALLGLVEAEERCELAGVR